MKRLTTPLAGFPVLLLALLAGQLRAVTVRFSDGAGTPRTEFALRDLHQVLVAQGNQVVDGKADVAIEIALSPGLPPQGYALRKNGGLGWRVAGGDDLGAMYGILELTEQVSLKGNCWPGPASSIGSQPTHP